MKKITSVILLLAALACHAQTNINVIYSFMNGLGQYQFVKQFSVQPMAVGVFSNAYVIGEEVKRVVSGPYYTNRMISGFAYKVRYYAQTQPDIVTAIYTNYFPTNISGTVYATAFTAISTNLGNGVYALTKAQADLLYAPLGSSTSAGITNKSTGNTLSNLTVVGGTFSGDGSGLTGFTSSQIGPALTDGTISPNFNTLGALILNANTIFASGGFHFSSGDLLVENIFTTNLNGHLGTLYLDTLNVKGNLSVTNAIQTQDIIFSGSIYGDGGRLTTLDASQVIGALTSATIAATALTGTLPAARLPAFSGDATSSAGASALTLATVATPGTSTKLTYNAKGLVTSGTSLALSDLPAGYNTTAGGTTNLTQLDNRFITNSGLSGLIITNIGAGGIGLKTWVRIGTNGVLELNGQQVITNGQSTVAFGALSINGSGGGNILGNFATFANYNGGSFSGDGSGLTGVPASGGIAAAATNFTSFADRVVTNLGLNGFTITNIGAAGVGLKTWFQFKTNGVAYLNGIPLVTNIPNGLVTNNASSDIVVTNLQYSMSIRSNSIFNSNPAGNTFTLMNRADGYLLFLNADGFGFYFSPDGSDMNLNASGNVYFHNASAAAGLINGAFTVDSGYPVSFDNGFFVSDGSGNVTTVSINGDGSALVNLNANNISSGTLAGGIFPATLPAVSGANLTALPNPLPASSGANLTAINAGAINHTIISTNWIPGKIYLNTYGTAITVSGKTSLGVAAIVGAADLCLRSDAKLTNGGWTNDIAMSTLITSIAMNYTNFISLEIPTNANFTFTNLSTGVGNTATVVGGQLRY